MNNIFNHKCTFRTLRFYIFGVIFEYWTSEFKLIIMRSFYTLFFVLIILASCNRSTKMLQRGDYDAAITQSVKKIMKDPTNSKEVSVLAKSYSLANERDNNIINELKLSGQPDIWAELFDRYSNMRARQDVVSRLPNEVLSDIDFKKVDYNSEISKTKNKAAAFYYANGTKLLQSGDRMSARKAYAQFSFIRKYFANYKDIDVKMQQALAAGTNHVNFKIQNHARVALPKDFENEILKISLSSLNKQWIEFDTQFDEQIYYDYNIFLNLKNIEVSPQNAEKEKYRDVVSIEDGWEYVLDNNGNVMKDSSGNDLKRTKMKDIYAYVTLTKLYKRSIVKGSLDYYDNNNGQLIKTTPITSEFIFDYQFAEFAGEDRALSEKSRNFIKNLPRPFPTDLQMIYDTNSELKKVAFARVKRDRNMFLQ